MAEDTIKHLEEKEHDLQEQLEDLEAHDPSKDRFRTYDNNMEDDSDEAERGSRMSAMRRVIREQLKQVRNALHKLRRGSYAVCDRCGQPISEERLAAVPEATYCLSCEQELERQRV